MVNSLYQKYDGKLVPIQINEDLANEERYRRSRDNVLEGTNTPHLFLEPPLLNRVMNFLKKEGFLFNIMGKNDIENEFRIRHLPGRPAPSGFENSSAGGRPSTYKFTGRFDKIINLMAKPEAQALLKKRLLSISLTYQFERFNLEALVLCARIDCSVVENLISIFSPPDRMPNLPELRPFIQSLASLRDDQLKSFVDQYLKRIAETRRYDMNFLFGLTKLE